MKQDRFEFMTRRKGFHKTIDGLHEAISVGFDSIKVNCVVIKGFNDDEIISFIELAMRNPIEVRFIEFMPFASNNWNDDRVIHSQVIIDKLRIENGIVLQQLKGSLNDVSRVYSCSGMIGKVGFISSISNNFCSGCNRLRITADGNFKNCLFGREETSLRDLLRNGASDEEVVKAVNASLKRKWKKHPGRLIQQEIRQMQRTQYNTN